MIFDAVARGMYNQIIEIELQFLMRYKLNPFELFSNMTLLDLETYMTRLSMKIEEEEKDKSKQNNFAKSLVALRDLLNYMTL